MDSNISVQIKRLMEVDKRAIELENQRENELKMLNQVHKEAKEQLESQLKTAKDEAKKSYELLVKQAQKEVEGISSEVEHKLKEVEKAMNQEVDKIAAEWWGIIRKDLL